MGSGPVQLMFVPIGRSRVAAPAALVGYCLGAVELLVMESVLHRSSTRQKYSRGWGILILAKSSQVHLMRRISDSLLN